MIKFLKNLFKTKEKDVPVPGKDARWLASCIKCQEMTSFVSRDGFKDGGIQHCYQCGKETEIKGFKKKDVKRMINDAYSHWKKFPLIPYNWHLLTEKEKWGILDGT